MGSTLHEKGKSNLPLFLQRRIHFREATLEESSSSASLQYKYSQQKAERQSNFPLSGKQEDDGFQGPEKELFPAQRVLGMLKWSRIRAIGPGLVNLGNTCFLNSVLQCLTYTPPLANYLLSKEHGSRCKLKCEFCLMCEMERHVGQALEQNSSKPRSIQPTGTVGHLRLIAKHMRLGRQEDSHEFLRFLVDYLQKNLLAAFSAGTLDVRTKETTLIHQIFGGYLQSRVKCLSCGHTSRTYDPFMDISLDLRQADSIHGALQNFVSVDRLTRANRYRCDSCNRLSEAEKSMAIYRPPNILTVHLKRFNMNIYGEMGKINKHIEFAPELDISPFLVNSHALNAQYELYAVLVHEGQTCNSGHYHAFVKASNGIWYSMNDSSVTQVSLATVLKQRAYLLFYVRDAEATNHSMVEAATIVKELQSVHPSLQQNDDRKNRLITPPATPDPEPIPSIVKKPKVITEQPTPIISSSMWHLSDVDSKDASCNRDTCSLSFSRRIFPSCKWMVRSLLLKQ